MDNSNFEDENRSARLHGTHSPQNISLYGFFLGCLFTFGLGILCLTDFWQIGGYILCLSIFHHLEYLLTALYKPENLQLDSYLLNHSTAYTIAIFVGLFEYFLEDFSFLSQKNTPGFVRWVSILLVLCGQIIRTLAMHTAKASFNHQVVDYKAQEHVLVTWGIYKYLRHPSYFGFYVWSVGMQLLLANPISLLLYLYALNRFFAGRIVYEEITLHRFFGQKYKDYCSETWTWLPLVYPKKNCPPSAEQSE
ncbi:farnesyl cysteine-carboxyl methyltransferase, mediates the carboxyl methylation step during C-termin [Basidiobolus meristosporus CBS 931.73]|uniref:Protein-S-isoprenylcysteine O-methyltransferase n=1 Tax=Basidiobolus meristosporus CBS 931.73 TaxID=1314790 RepID=A0A1Y1XUV0_9FUNG|nr:farnesyl cysteine-carboxyl methyltransferase, mediates the carboxyl methylation step during C-termin [Basidiobolus meristosporus CBS 931.73]|eukprot:ORX89520.1 farnesyl cysteine-carboxyl methyltransferase, mediates the carboxyl methylation step during C-termin [Basidiobolus meristosporus CBS 931.73]